MPLETHTFLRQHRDEIIAAWEAAASAEQRDVKLTGSALRDHLSDFLDELARWLESGDEPGTTRMRAAAAEHAAGRVRDAYQLTQLISELRVLRSTILRLLLRAEAAEPGEAAGDGKDRRVVELARLNAGLDHAITDAVEHFVASEADKLQGAERVARAGRTDLRASEERFRALVTATSDVLYRMSADWSEMRQLTGGGFLASTEAPDRGWLELYIHPDDRPRVMAAIDEAIRTRSTFELEHRVVRKDGTLGWTISRAIPVKDESGAVVEWFGAATDVTDRKRAEEALRDSEGRYRTLFEAMAEGFTVLEILFDEEGTGRDARFIEVNQAFERQTGLRAADVLGKTVRELFPKAESGWFERYGSVASTGEPAHFEAAFGPLGKWFEVSAYRTEPGRVAVVFFESTERRQALEALRQADRRKDEFLGMLSHELRNPLAPIRNSIYLLERAAPGTEPARRALQVIRRQTEHFTRLVDDLLDVTRISRGKVALQPSRVDLREVVLHAAEDFRLLLRDRSVAFDVAVPDAKTWADADPTRIAQVLGNLLHNASKFTRSGDRVTVTMRVVDGRAEIRVRDTGVGIEPRLLPLVFDPFVQGERTLARTGGGLGLGLALVKGITELHGGTVSVESAGEGEGAEFVVRLPLAAAGGEVGRVAAAQLPDGGRRVLVVDDNADAAESLADVARMAGHEVEVAYDGASALERARSKPFDVILCDIGLPGMSGYDVARTIRSTNGTAVQLVAVSGYAQPEDVRQSIDAGFDAHIAKPPDLEELMKLLAADLRPGRAATHGARDRA